MNFYKTLFVILHLAFIGETSVAQNSWVIKKDKEGIQISTRQSDRSKFNDIKAEMDLPGNIFQLSSILLAVNQYSQWSYSTKKSILVKKVAPNRLIYYSRI